jgi:hypothetical protein
MNLKKLCALVPTILLVLVPSLCAAETGKRHNEAAGGFSFCPPKGWTEREFPGFKYKIFTGPVTESFAANINVVDEAASGSLEDYVKGNAQAISRAFKAFKKLSQSEFKTDSGVKGVKLVTESDQGGHALRQTFFFFDGKAGKKFVVTCSASAGEGAKLDETFTASLKTFALEK